MGSPLAPEKGTVHPVQGDSKGLVAGARQPIKDGPKVILCICSNFLGDVKTLLNGKTEADLRMSFLCPALKPFLQVDHFPCHTHYSTTTKLFSISCQGLKRFGHRV